MIRPQISRAAVCAAYADKARSLRDVGGEFGLTKTQVYSIILADAPHLLGRTQGAKRVLDREEVRRLTLAGRTRAEIATELGFDYETIRKVQVEIGLHKTRPYTKPAQVPYDAEPPCGKQIGRWPPGVWFTSLQMKPMRARAPEMPERGSGIGCGTLMAAEG